MTEDSQDLSWEEGDGVVAITLFQMAWVIPRSHRDKSHILKEMDFFHFFEGAEDPKFSKNNTTFLFPNLCMCCKILYSFF